VAARNDGRSFGCGIPEEDFKTGDAASGKPRRKSANNDICSFSNSS
jgi:hypothetical protein